MNNAVMFESAGDERGTPQDFFDQLNAEFHFDIDCAASALNHKCDLYFGFGGMADDALEADWGGPGTTCWLNPPYSVVGAFVKKAREEADKGATVVLLVPARTETKWWQTYVWDKDALRPSLDPPKADDQQIRTSTMHRDGFFRDGVRVRFIQGRLNFELHVPTGTRNWIKSELKDVTDEKERDEKIRQLVKTSGLPKMAIERICEDQPDDCLMDSAPFPSCVVIFTKT